MTEIEKKALELLNERHSPYEYALEDHPVRVLIRAIEQHEAFRQEVSDAVADYCGYVPPNSPSHPITRFIIAKPDPLVEAWDEVLTQALDLDEFRAALAKRGLEIREKK